MGLVDRIRQQRQGTLDYPVGPLVVQPWDEAHGHDASHFAPESYGDFLVTSNDVYSAVLLRARLASSLPLRLYDGSNVDKVERASSTPANLLRYVNPHWSIERLERMDELAMGVFGASYWAVEKDARGVPKEIWWLKPSRVKPIPDKKKYLKGFRYESNVNGQVLEFTPDEIVWFRYPNPLDEFTPLSPIVAARLAAETSSAMMHANRNLHKNGLSIAGVLSPKGDRVQFTKPQALELEDDLQRRFSGADKAHKWAVLRYEAEFKPVNITPKDAEFIHGLGITARMIFNAYGVPAPLLNDMEGATLANVREFQTILWEHALRPDMQLRAGDIREQFLPMFKGRHSGGVTHAEYDFGGVAALQKSNSEAWTQDRQAMDAGALTINEWRARKGLPPVPWGDVWWAPVNKAAVTDAKSTPQGDTSPTSLPDKGSGVEPPEISTEQAWDRVIAALSMDGGA